MSRVSLHIADCLETMARMEPNSLHAIITDPPYGLSGGPAQTWDDAAEGRRGFMGHSWDGAVPGVAFAKACARVLRPGGWLVAFGAPRTVHRLAVSIEDGGLEIRDRIHHLFYTGFPKSLSASAAIDAQRNDRTQILIVTAWIAAARDAAGLTNAQIDQALGFHGMAGHWTSQRSQPTIPKIEQVEALLAALGVTLDDVPANVRRLLWELNARKGERGEAWHRRPVIGHSDNGIAGGTGGLSNTAAPSGWGYSAEFTRTTGATAQSRLWEGFGTNLKPAIEIAILARKPLDGTLADNLVRWGCGALNIDACRFAPGSPNWPGPQDDALSTHSRSADAAISKGIYGDSAEQVTHQRPGQALGRWPANVFACPKEPRRSREWGCEGLDPRSGAEAVKRGEGTAGLASPRAGAGRTARRIRNFHPTVKPLHLMRWIATMVRPPRPLPAVMLDPFLGSGTTGMAVVGLDPEVEFIGVEIDAAYMEVARARIAWAAGHPVTVEGLSPQRPGPQLSLLGAP